jgi:hypothetical protein
MITAIIPPYYPRGDIYAMSQLNGIPPFLPVIIIDRLQAVNKKWSSPGQHYPFYSETRRLIKNKNEKPGKAD